MLLSPLGFNTELLQTDSAVLMPGPTYVVTTANVLGYAIEQDKLQPGDTIGSIVFEGSFGDDSEKGTDVAAKAAGLKVAKTRIKPSDTDFVGPIAIMRQAGAKIVVIGSSPTQLSAMLSTANAQGYNPAHWVTGNTGSFNPALLTGPAAQLMQDKLLMASGAAVWSMTDVPGVKDLHAAFEAEKPKVEPGAAVVLAYGQARVFAEIIESTCDDLTREGLVKAFRAMRALDTEGLILPLDFTRGGGKKSPALAIHIVRPDKAADGGLKLVEAAYTSEAVKGSDL
jgi:ABC-type branched-subunit amino acid transport system substrate-binding protein